MILEDHDIDRLAEAVAARIQKSSQEIGASLWLTANEAAEYLRCTPRHINKLAYRGELPTYKPAGKRLFKREDLDALAHQTEET